MEFTVAVLGAGRMGTFIGGQLPKNLTRIVIDKDEAKAKELADSIGSAYSASYDALKDTDVIIMVLPKPVIAPAARELVGVAKAGAVVLNMATGAAAAEATVKSHPQLRFVDAQIIGHAKSMMEGAPGYAVVNTQEPEVLEKARYCLPGFAKVVPGDSSLVAKINKIGSGEGIAAAVKVRKLLRQCEIPDDWADIVIYTVCAGTMRSYVQGDLGEFARKLADQLEAEG